MLTESFGIDHQRTVPFTHEQNCSMERENRTVVEAERTMIHNGNFSANLWVESVNMIVTVLNKSRSKRGL